MKDLFYRFCRWALPFLGVSTVISCDNVFNGPDMYGTQVAEYGVPVMEYKVSGKVTDKDTGAPIKGIQVTSEESLAQVFTSATGEFTCEGATFPDDKVTITFEDIDGYENGAYVTQEIEVAVEKSEDGSGWFAGVYIADDVLVKLMPGDVVTPEYGVPMAEFSVKGRVVDTESNPIGNIEVSGSYYTVRTAADGTFHYQGEVDEFELSEVTLHFTDRDGEENGGEFETKTETIPLVQSSPGDGAWDTGDYTAEDIEIVLERK